MATNNAINLQAAGVVTYNGAGAFTASTFSQYTVLLGGVSNAISSAAPSATSGVPLISQGAAANPAFGTAVVAGGGTGLATLVAYELLAAGTTSTGNLQQIGLGSAGQVLTSNGAGALASYATLPANSFPWSVVTGATQTLAVNHGYVSNAASGGVEYTMPTTASVGALIRVTGLSAGSGWSIDTPAGVTIQFGNVIAAANTTGALSSTVNTDTVELLCAVANTTWIVLDSMGNISYID